MRVSVRAKLLLVNLGAVAAATLLAGGGVVRVAWAIVTHRDLMAAKHFPEFQRETLLYLGVVSLVTFALAGGAAWLLSRHLIRPLLRIREAAGSIAAGNYSMRLREPAGDELGDVAAAIDRMSESLERIEGLRRDLVANVAHELRTPLTAAQGLISAMHDGLLPSNEANLEAAGEEIARLIRLVEALHQLSLSDSATAKGLAEAPLDLAALVREIAAGMAPLFEQKRQALAVEAGPAPLWVSANRDALVQVLVNLLDNACKYAPEGQAVRVAADRDGACVRLRVTNTGSEVAPADLPYLFERFFRGEKSRSRSLGGAGIGLAIVRNLVEAHRGRVAVTSHGGATTFTVHLPAA